MTRMGFRAWGPLALWAAATTPAWAQETQAPQDESRFHPAAGVEVWASTDSDDTDVIKLSGRALWNFEGRDKYQGITVEKAWFKPIGQQTREDERVYVDLADDIGGKWLWKAKVGTDGDTVLGSASVRSADWKYNLFVEREIIETPIGVDDGLYYTFVGGSVDLPVNERNVFTVMTGVQEFTGKNERLHLRGTYTHVLKPEWGLSAQLRGRYYHSTRPYEYDYFSPRDYVEVLPVVQLRRFTDGGWMYLLAAGYGAQKATYGDWQESRYADLRIESPVNSRKLNAFLQVQYSNTSITGGPGYDYVMGRMGVTFAF